MSATLEDAARSPMKKVDIPITDYTPATEEEIKEFKELSRELAKIPPSIFAVKNRTRKRPGRDNMSLSDEETISIVRQLSDEEYSKLVEDFYKDYNRKPFRRRGEQKLSRTPPEMRQSIPKPGEVKTEVKK